MLSTTSTCIHHTRVTWERDHSSREGCSDISPTYMRVITRVRDCKRRSIVDSGTMSGEICSNQLGPNQIIALTDLGLEGNPPLRIITLAWPGRPGVYDNFLAARKSSLQEKKPNADDIMMTKTAMYHVEQGLGSLRSSSWPDTRWRFAFFQGVWIRERSMDDATDLSV